MAESRIGEKSVAVERLLLGSILADIDMFKGGLLSDVLMRVSSGMFYDDRYGKLLDVMKSLNDEPVKLDLALVMMTALEVDKSLDAEFVLDVSSSVGTTANVWYYCDQLGELYKQRMFLRRFAGYNKRLVEGDVNTSGIVSDFDQFVGEYGVADSVEILRGQSLADRRVAGLKERMRLKPRKTGFEHLDRLLTQGLSRKTVSVIAGRPSMGKSTFKTALTIDLCEAGAGVISFCPEQTVDVEMDRFNAAMTGVPIGAMARCKHWGEDDPRKELMNENMLKIAEKWNFSIVADRQVTIDEIAHVIRRTAKTYPVDVIFVDVFDQVKDVDVVNYKPQAVTVALNRMCGLAKELDVHVCLLVQIKRMGGRSKRADFYIPTLEDLKDSGTFEERADLIFMLYREGYYDERVEDNVLTVNIAKQRNGIAGPGIKKDLTFDKSILKLRTPDESDVPEERGERKREKGKPQKETDVW